MANPQKENGFTPIASELVEALAEINLSAYESRILWALFRKTYGWHKKADRVSRSQFAEITGLDPRHISRTLANLLSRNIIIKKAVSPQVVIYSIQKDYTLWKPSRDKDTAHPF